MLYCYAFWPQKRRGHLLKTSKQNVQKIIGKDYESIHRRYSGEKQTLVRPRQLSQRNVRSIETLWYEAQPNKMCIRSILWAILGL